MVRRISRGRARAEDRLPWREEVARAVGREKGRLLERVSIHDGRVVKLAVEKVRLPNGNVTELEVIHHQGAAAAVPLDESGQVWLVRQYRHAVGDWLLEIPAGKLDPGEDPERCASREVAEEVGQRPAKLVSLGWIFTTPGFTDERIWLYLATGLEPAGQNLQHDEVLTVERLPLDEAVRRAARGEIHDAKSVCALLRARDLLDRGV